MKLLHPSAGTDVVEDIEDLISTGSFEAGDERIRKTSVVPRVRKRAAIAVNGDENKAPQGDSIIPGDFLFGFWKCDDSGNLLHKISS